jgi:hypothetical protein
VTPIPNLTTRNALRFYELVLEVIALAEVFGAEAIGIALAWLRSDQATRRDNDDRACLDAIATALEVHQRSLQPTPAPVASATTEQPAPLRLLDVIDRHEFANGSMWAVNRKGAWTTTYRIRTDGRGAPYMEQWLRHDNESKKPDWYGSRLNFPDLHKLVLLVPAIPDSE